jgi:hypothetical protein
MTSPLQGSNSPQPLKILTLKQLAEDFFGVTSTALHCRRHRNPNSLPPSIQLPGTKTLLFSLEEVTLWFLSHQEKRENNTPSLYKQPKSTSTRKKGASTKIERITARQLGISVQELRQKDSGK